MGNEIALSEAVSEYEALVIEVKKLKMIIATLSAEKDDLELNVCRKLRAEYDEKVGDLELQITSYNLEIEKLRTMIERMQAAVNRDEQLSREKAKRDAEEELKSFYDELGKKAEQAKQDHDFAERRAQRDKENAENAGYDGEGDDDEKFDWEQFFNDINNFNKAFEDFMKALEGLFGDDGSQKGEEDTQSDNHDRGGSAKKNMNPAKELKLLYRKIVKALHPDNKPDRTPKDDELLHQAKKAFEEGDLERLRQIAEMIDDEDIEKRFKNTPEDLMALIELRRKLKLQMMLLQRQISSIKMSFPYNQKEFLADEDAVAARQDELRKIIESCKRTIAALNERIDLLQMQMRMNS